MREDLRKYRVEVVSVMITNIHLPAELMKTTQQKNLAEQEQSMFDAKKKAEEIMEFIEMTGQSNIEGYNLTAFDRKKLELGRALATGPQLLLLDEVVAGANPHEAAAMMELIKRVQKKGITILIVEHVMKVIMGLSDRLVVLHHGEKLAEGSPDEIYRNEKVLNAYLGEKYARTRNS